MVKKINSIFLLLFILISKNVYSSDIYKYEENIKLEINERITRINEKISNFNEDIEKEELRKEEELKEIIKNINYVDVDRKRVSPFENINEVSWNIEDDKMLISTASDYEIDFYNENVVERVSMKNSEILFESVFKGLLKEIEVPSNGKKYTYSECKGTYRFSLIHCSDPKMIGMLSISKLDNETIKISHENEYGKFFGILKNETGYIIDLTESEVIYLHD